MMTSCDLRGKTCFRTVLELWESPGIYWVWRRGCFRGSCNRVKTEIAFQQVDAAAQRNMRGQIWGDRGGSEEAEVRRIGGTAGNAEKYGSCPVHTQVNTFSIKNQCGQSCAFEIVTAMCKVDWRREIMEAVVQWEIMRLWTKKVAEQTISRGVAEAELTGWGNWLDVVAWEKERSREGLPGCQLGWWVNGSAPHWHSAGVALKGQQWIDLDLLILRDQWTRRRIRSVES